MSERIFQSSPPPATPGLNAINKLTSNTALAWYDTTCTIMPHTYKSPEWQYGQCNAMQGKARRSLLSRMIDWNSIESELPFVSSETALREEQVTATQAHSTPGHTRQGPLGLVFPSFLPASLPPSFLLAFLAVTRPPHCLPLASNLTQLLAFLPYLLTSLPSLPLACPLPVTVAVAVPFLRTELGRTYIHTSLSTYLPFYLPTFLPSYLPTYLPSFFPSLGELNLQPVPLLTHCLPLPYLSGLPRACLLVKTP